MRIMSRPKDVYPSQPTAYSLATTWRHPTDTLYLPSSLFHTRSAEVILGACDPDHPEEDSEINYQVGIQAVYSYEYLVRLL